MQLILYSNKKSNMDIKSVTQYLISVVYNTFKKNHYVQYLKNKLVVAMQGTKCNTITQYIQ